MFHAMYIGSRLDAGVSVRVGSQVGVESHDSSHFVTSLWPALLSHII